MYVGVTGAEGERVRWTVLFCIFLRSRLQKTLLLVTLLHRNSRNERKCAMQDVLRLDIASINRNYLLHLREVARGGLSEIFVGIPRDVMQRIAKMSMDEIEKLASTLPASVISFRLADSDVDRLLNDSVKPAAAAHYAASMILQRSTATQAAAIHS